MKITYEPFKELVVKEFTKFEKISDLINAFEQLRAIGQPVSLNWAEGVVFVYSLIPPTTDELVQDYLKGRIYYTGIAFALMEQYEPSVTYKSPQARLREKEIAVPIINVNTNKILSKLATWLKTQS